MPERSSDALCYLSEEVVGEVCNVFATFPQRRQMDRKYRESVKEISTEEPLFNGLFEITIRGSDERTSTVLV